MSEQNEDQVKLLVDALSFVEDFDATVYVHGYLNGRLILNASIETVSDLSQILGLLPQNAKIFME